jgi:folate-binding protein YgfZ
LVDVSDTLALYSWWGIAADSVMSSVDPRHPSLGYIGLSSQLTSTLTVMDYDSVRIPLALPDGTRDMPFEKAIPLEHNLDKANAVDWDKGCYMGQELTARTRYRGLVRKRLFALQKQSGDMPQQGTPVLLGDEEIGDVRSHTDTLALAYLRIEQAESSSLLQAGQATFAVLPS